MLLKSIKLENIRSYTNQEIVFPSGSTLLSGDIGSGKTTILLGIEFALFGIRRKHLDGNALLRHGKTNGSVELKFVVDGKEIIVKRTLKKGSGKTSLPDLSSQAKKGKERVEQDSGYILIDGVKKAGTAVELKTWILELLGYPRELVTKTKNLVYRYTVYTPQEEMKEILIEEEEARLDTLRKVFGIDKYKRIGENALILTRGIKEKRKEFTGKISDLEEKKRQRKEAKGDIEEIELKKENLVPKLEKTKKEITERKENLEKIEGKIKELNSLKKESELVELDSRNKHNEFTRVKNDAETMGKRLEELRKELEGKEVFEKEIFEDKINSKEKEILASEKRVREIDGFIREANIKKKNADEIKSKILKLAKCPTCEQEVSKEYKDSITKRENYKVIDADKLIETYSEKMKEEEKKVSVLKGELVELRKKQSEVNVIILKKRELAEKEKKKDELLVRQGEIKKSIGELHVKKSELSKKIENLKDVEEEYSLLRQKIDEVVKEERNLEIEKRGLEERVNGIKKMMEAIDSEIERKEKSKEKLEYLGELLEWIEKGFVKLTATMEKQVMLNVYHEFNELFKRWFDILMEDSTINVRLDDSFSPVVEQNGYEVDVVNLSGGERTAAALAYRLALNKVVNDLMTGIKTRDLIILDEPTDGFSSEQLDKVRDVLEQIGTKQTIIVSHESKIESFVDNVVKINKNEHVSGVI